MIRICSIKRPERAPFNCRGVHAEAAGNAGNFAGREHESNAHQRVILEHHKSRNEDGGLEEGGQAQADDLPHPAHKAVQIAPWDAEHIEGADCNLNQQNAASL